LLLISNRVTAYDRDEFLFLTVEAFRKVLDINACLAPAVRLTDLNVRCFGVEKIAQEFRVDLDERSIYGVRPSKDIGAVN
jgi:hypothetical protein